jgi:hypothetical protein
MRLSRREQVALRRRCTLHVSGHAADAPGAELGRALDDATVAPPYARLLAHARSEAR